MFSKQFEGPGGISQLLYIAIPMVVSQACETIMMFTDRLFLSQVSPMHMSASMSGGVTAFMFSTFFIGLTGYATPLVAQYLGSGNKKLCGVVIFQALIITFLSYPLILAVIPIGHWLFSVVSHSPQQIALETMYFDILMYGTVLGLARNSINAFFSGIGRTRMVMISALVTMSVNVVVNYMLILGNGGFPAMGIKGAAIGTIIGSACGLITVMIGYIHSHKNNPQFELNRTFHFDWSVMKKLLRFGSPGGLELFLNLLAFDLVILIFHSYGPIAAASVTIAFNFDLLFFIPLIGVNIGVTSLVGRYMGSGDPNLAHRTMLSGLKVVTVYGVLMIALFVFLPEPLVSIFINSPTNASEVSQMASVMLQMVAIYVIADGYALVYSGALRGSGDTFWTMVISVTLHWLFLVEVLVLIKWLQLSPIAAWIAFVLFIPIIAVAFILRYRSGAWRKIKVVDGSHLPTAA
jgi:MATE family multidrug resistance protein